MHLVAFDILVPTCEWEVKCKINSGTDRRQIKMLFSRQFKVLFINLERKITELQYLLQYIGSPYNVLSLVQFLKFFFKQMSTIELKYYFNLQLFYCNCLVLQVLIHNIPYKGIQVRKFKREPSKPNLLETSESEVLDNALLSGLCLFYVWSYYILSNSLQNRGFAFRFPYLYKCLSSTSMTSLNAFNLKYLFVYAYKVIYRQDLGKYRYFNVQYNLR